MSQPLSHDLRIRVLSTYLEGHSYEKVAAQYGVSVRFIRNLKARYDETGSVEPRPHGGGAPQRLSSEDKEALKRWVTAHPDWSLSQYKARLQSECGVLVSESTISRTLERLGFTRKKRASMQPSSEHPPFEPPGASSKR